MTSITSLSSTVTTNNANAPLVATPLPTTTSSSGVTFGDIVDAVNPLQHIPVVSGVYRAANGTPIASGSQAIGDAVYGVILGGGLLAVGSAAANLAVQQATGQDITQHVMNNLLPAAPVVAASATNTTVSASSQPLLALKTTNALSPHIPSADYHHHGQKKYQQAQQVSMRGLLTSGLDISS